MNSKNQFRRNPVFSLAVLMIVVYLVQFVVFPSLLPNYFPTSNEASWMHRGTLLVAILGGGIWISANLKYWVLADIIYLWLPCLYSANGAYGVRISLNSKIQSILFETTLNAIFILAVQALILGILHVIIQAICRAEYKG